MAGGAGTRLWPLSREEKPKQFLNLSGRGTLLEETILRVKPLNPDKTIIVTAKSYESLSLYEIKNSGLPGAVLCEPRPRNTAAAVLYAAYYIESAYTDAVMIVMPADHYIINTAEFTRVIQNAVRLAEAGRLVTIGIRPSYPETGYGYIKSSDEIEKDAYIVERFVEKPLYETAKKYVESGDYYWNSGIFVWRASSIISAFKKYLPEQISAFSPMRGMTPEMIESDSIDIWNIKKQIFDSLESVSIDNGILEKSDNTAVIAGGFGWADLGSWKAADDILIGDENQNRSPDKEKSLFVNSENCSVFTEGSRVSIVGLKNITVVQAGNDILVIDKESSQDVKRVVEILKSRESGKK